MVLRLIVVEHSQNSADASGLAANIQITGESINRRGSAEGRASIAWIPGSQDQIERVVARPRLVLQPGQPAKLDVGGEIQRAGADGAVEDKEYGLSLHAEFLWVDPMTIQFNHATTLRSPAGEGQFKRQSLEQGLTIGVSQVVELARFEGIQSTALTTSNGLPVTRNEGQDSKVTWKIMGWLEPSQGVQ